MIKAWLIKKFPMLIVVAAIGLCGYYIAHVQAVAEAALIKVAEREQILAAQTRTLESLLDERVKIIESVERLSGSFEGISKNLGSLTVARKKIEAENEIIKNYLDSPIPLDLRRLYNK